MDRRKVIRRLPRVVEQSRSAGAFDRQDELLALRVLLDLGVEADEALQELDEAARVIPLEQLALSPQCGFASVAGGNLLNEDDQWRKLELVVETARRVWG